MDQMDISTTASESSNNDILNTVENVTVNVKSNGIEEILINDIDNSADNVTVESSSNESMEEKRVIYYQQRRVFTA